MRAALLAACVAVALQAVSGTHYRYGAVNWSPTTTSNSERSIRLFVRQAWRLGAFTSWRYCRSGSAVSTSCSVGNTVISLGTINWGDGRTDALSGMRIDNRCSGGGGDCDWLSVNKEFPHTYSSQAGSRNAPWRIQWGSCCRLSNLHNNPDGDYQFFTTVYMRPDNGYVNTSPVASQIPIQRVLVGFLNQWAVGANDRDADTLTYTAGTVRDMCPARTCRGAPAGLTVTSTGTASWSLASSFPAGRLNSMLIKVSDGYSEITLDFLLFSVRPLNICKNCAPGSSTKCRTCGSCGGGCQCLVNANPALYQAPGSPFLDPNLQGTVCFLVGQAGSFLIGVHDPVDRECDTVQVNAGALPNGAAPPSLAQTVSPNWDRRYRFSWTPAPSDARIHQVTFFASDAFNGISQPQSLSLFVPTVTESQLPSVTTYSPQSTDFATNPILAITGANFARGSGLMCRFTLTGQAPVLTRPVFQNTGAILCAMPNKAALGGSNDGVAPNNVRVEVSNIFSCDVWRRVTPDFTFEAACPPGTAGPTCSSCPPGKYQTTGNAGTGGAQCNPCIAGRYGNAAGLTSPTCSGPCASGHYCPPGTVNPTDNDCPAGRYGDSAGIQDAGCSGLCQAGFYCTAGSTSARAASCPPGRYGGSGESANTCAGPCQAGYFCGGSSPSATQNECGGVQNFCNEGSAVPAVATAGRYTTGSTNVRTRTAASDCEPGFYCTGGLRTACPAGRYQAVALGQAATCQGPCRAGFYCPTGSTSDSPVPCGQGVAKPATVFCPTGSGAPTGLTDVNAYYSTPEDAPADQRSGEEPCTASEFCVDGFRRQRTQWTAVCAGGGATVAATYGVQELTGVTPFTVAVQSNEDAGRITVTSVTYAGPPGCPAPAVGAWTSAPAATGASTTVQLSAPGLQPNHEECDHFMATIVATTDLAFETTCNLRIEVEDLNDCPVWDVAAMQADPALWPVPLEENPALGTGLPLQLAVQGVVTDEDEGAELQFSILSVVPPSVTPGAPAGLFGIGRCSGQLFVNSTEPSDVDWEWGVREWDVLVQVNDTAAVNPCALQQVVKVTAINVNEAPVFLAGQGTFTVPENSPRGAGTTPPLVRFADPDGNYSAPGPSQTFNLPQAAWFQPAFDVVAQSDPAAPFDVDPPTGALRVAVDDLDFETMGTPTVTVSLRVRDNGVPSLSTTDDFLVAVTDVNDPPVVPPSQLFAAELLPPGTVIGQVTAQDDEYDFNPASASLTWAVVVAQFGDGSCGTHPNPFAIAPTTTAGFDPRVTADLVVAPGAVLDYELLAQYTLTVTAQDGGHNGFPPQSGAGTVVVDITNVNEPPTVTGAPATLWVPENELAPHAFGPAFATFADDPDKGPGCVGGSPSSDPLIFSFDSGDRGDLAIDGASGQVSAVAVLNHEAAFGYLYTLSVQLADPSTSITFPLTVNVTNVNEPPVLTPGQTLWLTEDALPGVAARSAAGSGAGAGTLVATDPDFDDDAASLTYTVAAGDSGDGLLVTAGRSLETAPGTVGGVANWRFATFDFESTPNVPVTITVTDRHGAASKADVDVALVNALEPPFLNATTVSVAENTPAPVTVLTLTVQEDDVGDTHTYSILGVDPASDAGANCAALFAPGSAIVNVDELTTTATAPNLPGTPLRCILDVQAEDQTGLTNDAKITVEVTLGNLPPAPPATQAHSVPETAATGSIIVPDLGGADPDTEQVLTYVLVSAVDGGGGNAATLFTTANGAECPGTNPAGQCPGALRLLGSLDFETMTTYTLVVQVSDSFSPPATARTTVTLTVANVNEAPAVQNAGGLFMFPESSLNGAGPSPDYQATAVDDEGDTLTWSAPDLAGTVFAPQTLAGEGALRLSEADAGVLAAAINYETHRTPMGFNFTVTDGATAVRAVYAVQIVDVNEAPDATVFPAALTLTEGQNRVGDVLAQVFGTDPDLFNPAWRTLSYSLPTPDADGIFEAVTNAGAQLGEVRVAAPVDYEKGSSYALDIRVTDGGSPPLSHDVTLPITVENVNDISISSIAGDWYNMSTAGGATLSLWGANLGHFHNSAATVTLQGVAAISRDDQAPFSLPLVFPCVQVTTNVHVTCTTTVGVGRDIAWKLQVEHPGGAVDVAPVTVNNGQQVLGSYGTPVLTGISGPHGALSTAGGEDVTLTGWNLPPTGLTAAFTYWRVQYGPSGGEYTASNTGASTDGSSVDIATAEGVGSAMSWRINVGGLESAPFTPAAPASAYAPPAITRVRLAAQAVPVPPGGEVDTIMAGAGGEEVVITGSNLGTAATLAVDTGFAVTYARLLASAELNGTTTVVPPQYIGGIGSGIAEGPTPLPAQFWVNLETRYTYTASACRVAVPHTELRCTSAPGAGGGLVFRTRVGGQDSAVVVGSAVSLSYHPPLVGSVGGLNAYNSPTRGGGEIDIQGLHLGAQGDARIVATYGRVSQPGRYTAASCATTEDDKAVRCYTVPGVGRDFWWRLSVAGQEGVNTPFDAGTRYASPILVEYDGPGARDADTRGGQLVLVEGLNFGPAGPDNINQATYFDGRAMATFREAVAAGDTGAFSPPLYDVTDDCTVSVAHEQIACNLTQGAGQGLKWEILIDGLLSAEVSTAYRVPSVDRFSGPAAVNASSHGNQSVVLEGADFGPTLAYIAANLGQPQAYLEWVRYTPFSTLSAGYYEAQDCAVLDHGRVRCLTQPGSGLGMRWFVRVRGQTSEASATAWSYEAPTIWRLDASSEFTGQGAEEVRSELALSVRHRTPRMWTNADGERIRIVGVGFGVDDPQSSLSVRVGAKTLTPTRTWWDAVEGAEVIEFVKPGGHGGSQTVQVVIDNLEPGGRLSNAYPFAYAPPRRLSQPRDENADDNTMIYNVTLTGSSFCQPATGPGPTVSTAVAAPLPVPASTDSPLDNCGQVYLKNPVYGGLVNPALTLPAVLPNWVRTVGADTLVPVPRERYFAWNDTYIKFWVYAGRGGLELTVGDQVTSLGYSSTTLSNRAGVCAAVGSSRAFQTAGGEVLTLPVDGACGVPVTVQFARVGSGDSAECVTLGTPSVDVPPPATLPGPFGTSTLDVGNGTGSACLVQCTVPPGDGGLSANGFIVDNGDSTTPLCPVAYAAPNVTAVSTTVAADGASTVAERTVSAPMTTQPVPLNPIFLDAFGNEPVPTLPPSRIHLTMPTTGGLLYLHGHNYGLAGPGVNSACRDSWVAVWGFTDTAAARAECLGLSVADAAVASHGHFKTPVTLAPGVGARHYLAVGVTGQAMRDTFVALDYARPVVDGVVPASVPSTGALVTISGSNFGADASTLTVWLGAVGGRRCANPVLTVPHFQISCFVPELLPGFATVGGSQLIVEVGGQLSCGPGDSGAACAATVAYQPPVITAVSSDSDPVPAGDSVRVVITGANFGRNTFLPPTVSEGVFDPDVDGLSDSSILAVLLLQRGRAEDLSYLVPDPHAVAVGSRRFDRGGRIVFHNHTRIEFMSPRGQGAPRTLRLFLGATEVTHGTPYAFAPPEVTAAFPQAGPTKGFITRLQGRSLGTREARSENPANEATAPSYAIAGFATKEELLSKTGEANGLAVTLTQTRSVVAADGSISLQQVQVPCTDLGLHWSLLTARWARIYLYYSSPFETEPEPAVQPALSAQYTSSDFYCFVPAGLGSDVPLTLDVDGTVNSVGFSLDYNTPYVATTQANPADALGQPDFRVRGSDFGRIDAQANPVAVYVGDRECGGAEQVSDGAIQCALAGGSVGPKVMLLTAGGYTNVSYPALAQGSLGSRALSDVLEGTLTALDHAGRPLAPRDVVSHMGALPARGVQVRLLPAGPGRVAIDVLHTSAVSGEATATPLTRVGQEAPPVAQGRHLQAAGNGTQDGFTVPSYALSDFPVNRLDGVFKVQFHCQIGSYGQVAEQCQACPPGGFCEPRCVSATAAGMCVDFQEPYSLPGWYGVPTTVGAPDCDRASRPEPYGSAPCLNFLPCEPQRACTGNNQCAEGYEGSRCGECSQGYFRVAGLCEGCPDLAGLYIALFVILLIAICGIGYVLNRKKMHLAFISIGVDYFQVLAMFATARVAWPQFLRDLYRILSIFQVNIDITAPECAIPNVSYAGKWFVIESLPLFLGSLLLLFHGVKYGLNVAFQVDRKYRNKHAPTLVAMALLLMYYLYLLLTKTTFDAFNCQPTEPDVDGKKYLEVEFVECYTPAHNLFFIPALVFTLPAYTIAYPVWVYWFLRRSKDRVKTDQILRAMGIGDTPLTNPNYTFRQQFHKLYYHFKPGKWYWLLVILFRKFCIALTGLMFRRTPSFQMAMACLVLLASFTMQVRHNPYMSMSERRGIILHHKAKAAEGNKKHQAIAAAYEAALRHSNARQRRRRVNMDSVLDSQQAAGQAYLFDYNTMEAVLLSCGCFVCLSGIMFQTGDPASDIYRAQRDALTVLVGIVIFASMIYFFTVFGFEVYTTCGGAQCSNFWGTDSEGNKRSDSKAGKGKGKGKGTRRDLKRAADIDAEMEAGGGMELNPMAMRATLQSDLGALNDILGADGLPTQEQWNLVRAHANTLNRDVTDLRWEVSKLQDKQDEVAERKRTVVGRNGKRRSILERALGLNKQAPGATPDVAGVIAAKMGAGGAAGPLAAAADTDEVDTEGVELGMVGGAGKGAVRFAGGSATDAPRKKRASLATLAKASTATWGPWTRCHDSDGLLWYHNSETGASSYDAPPGFDAEGSVEFTPDMAVVQAENLAAIAEGGDGESEEEDGEEVAAGAAAGAESKGTRVANPLAGSVLDGGRSDRIRRMSTSQAPAGRANPNAGL